MFCQVSEPLFLGHIMIILCHSSMEYVQSLILLLKHFFKFLFVLQTKPVLLSGCSWLGASRPHLRCSGDHAVTGIKTGAPTCKAFAPDVSTISLAVMHKS